MKFVLLVLLLGFSLSRTSHAQLEKEIESIEKLRKKRQFAQAEEHARSLISNEGYDEAEKIQFQIELMKIQTAAAYHESGKSRLEKIEGALKSADQFLLDYSAHSDKVLVEVQKGITELDVGKLLRQEFEAGANDETRKKLALFFLRRSDATLKECDSALAKEIPTRAKKEPTANFHSES